MLNLITSIVNTCNVSPPTSTSSSHANEFKTSLHTEMTRVRKVNSSSALKGYSEEMHTLPTEALKTKVTTNEAGEKFLIMLANTSIVRQVALTETKPPKPSINYTAAKKAYDLD